jgi:UDP:flavonoid glycosyltransferase YjiC (YdhE family)
VQHVGEERAQVVGTGADTAERLAQAAAVMQSLAVDLTLDDPDQVWLSQAARYLDYRARESAVPPAGQAGPPRLRLVR